MVGDIPVWKPTGLSEVTERRSDIKNILGYVHLEVRYKKFMAWFSAGSIEATCHPGHFYFIALQEKAKCLNVCARYDGELYVCGRTTLHIILNSFYSSVAAVWIV